MGNPRKPTALRIAQGDRKSRINRDEPKPPVGLGDPPPWFDDLSREAWSYLRERFGSMKIATQADEAAAAIYCRSYSIWRKASAIVEAEGLTIQSRTEATTKTGSVVRVSTKAHPLLPTIREAQAQMMRCLGQFGMTPSSRAGLKVDGGGDEEDALTKFLRERPR